MARKKPIILIADDEEATRDLYKMRFKKEPYKLIFAVNGREALDKAISQKPDAILLDIMMPNKSGITVLEELKKNKKTKEIPVMMLTVLPNKEIKEEALQLGADDYLVKENVTPSKVVKLVKKELKSK